MKARELENLGIPPGDPVRLALQAIGRAIGRGMNKAQARERVRAIVLSPTEHLADPDWGELAIAIDTSPAPIVFAERDRPAPWRSWGVGLESESVAQMERACRLPVAAAGALMPDAHVGYGLPIGGVLAAEGAVIPYAVGVDIACRMRLSVLDLPPETLDTESGKESLIRAIERETRFGVGAAFKNPRDHPVMDADWKVSPVTTRFRDKAWTQLGTSGSGNHFVEFGVLTVPKLEAAPAPVGGPTTGGEAGRGSGWSFDLQPGSYLALLSHSGSRGTGAAVCDRYSRIAMDKHPELPKDLKYLAWLDLNSPEGREYWDAMNLMGQYASANHECIHRHVLGALGAKAVAYVENHHNFAWKETHDLADGRGPRELIVHRKGATPAGAGVLGVIPGSMAAPGFVVRGRGSAPSLRSAAHGAGRLMSRTKARESFAWGNVKRELVEKNVQLISAGIDEVPGVYKDIHQVMSQQADLVETLARFDPRLVKMAPEGEKAED
jgi:tRNA-splicing ligase RtcB